MKRLFDVFIHEVIFDGERFLIVMKTTDESLDPEERQKEKATRKKFELLRFGDLIGTRTRVYAVRGRRLNRLTMRPESRRQDSNLRPLRPERSALPN